MSQPKAQWTSWLPRMKTSVNTVDESSQESRLSPMRKKTVSLKRMFAVEWIPVFQCGPNFHPSMFESDSLSDSEVPIAFPVTDDFPEESQSRNRKLQETFLNPERTEKERQEQVSVSDGGALSRSPLKQFPVRENKIVFLQEGGRREVPSLRSKEDETRLEPPVGAEQPQRADLPSFALEQSEFQSRERLPRSPILPDVPKSSDKGETSNHDKGESSEARPHALNIPKSRVRENLEVPKNLKISFNLAEKMKDLELGTERRALSMDTAPDKGLKLSHILRSAYVDVKALFRFDSELGRGASGVVRRCFDALTGHPYACKTIQKATLRSQLDVQDLIAEVRSLRIMQRHPYVVRLKGIFEDVKSVHIVMEYCEGGDLFSRVKQRRFFTEPEAAVVCKTLASVLAFAHDKGIMHRDIKPENILMASSELDVSVCLTDFGSAAFFKPGQKLNQLIGSPLYIAPSVLQHSYGPEADLWSLGVVLYILLCGVPPFWGRSNPEIFRNVQFGELHMEGPRWQYVSKGAKKLVARLLNRDDDKRITAKQVLKHPWISYHCGGDEREIYLRSRSKVVSIQSNVPSPGVTRTPDVGDMYARSGQEMKQREPQGTSTSRRRRHSLGSEKAEEVTFAAEVCVMGEGEGSSTLNDTEHGRCVLRRSPTPFRQSSAEFSVTEG